MLRLMLRIVLMFALRASLKVMLTVRYRLPDAKTEAKGNAAPDEHHQLLLLRLH